MPGHFRFLVSQGRRALGRVTVFREIIDPGYEEVVGLCYTMELRRNMFGVQVIHPPVVMADGQEQKLWSRKNAVTRDSYLRGWSVPYRNVSAQSQQRR